MNLDIYQIDAFAEQIFSGNPAAVCILTEFLPEPIMQALAMEMNLSETVFVIPKGDEYRIRWFSPTKEVKLCGHATLAAAHVLWNYYDETKDTIRFHSLSGLLKTTKITDDQGKEMIELDFPANPVIPVTMPDNLSQSLGGSPLETSANEDLIVLYSDASEIKLLEPDFNALKELPFRGICATAPDSSHQYDFVSRFFAPAYGINEDPVTGSLYTQLAPFYAAKLGKTTFSAYQASHRGGKLHITLNDNRVLIAGTATTVMHATLKLDI